MDQLFPFIGNNALVQAHDGTLKAFVDHESGCGKAPKSINDGSAKLQEQLDAAEMIIDHSIAQTPTLIVLGRRKGFVGKLSEK